MTRDEVCLCLSDTYPTSHAEKTIDYSIRAGNAAYAVFAYEEAASHWQPALELMNEEGGGQTERRARILWLLGDELISSGPKAVEYLEAAVPLYEELGDEQMVADVHSRLGLYLSGPNLGARDVKRAMDHFQKTEALLVKQPESVRHASFYVRMTAACIWAGRPVEGLAAARRAMDIGARAGDDVAWAFGAILGSSFLVRRGSVAEGLELANQARQRAAPINDTMLGSTVAWNGGGNYSFLYDHREGRAWFARELALPRTAQSVPRRTILHQMMALACAGAGDLAEGHRHLAEVGSGPSASLAYIEGNWESSDKLMSESFEGAKGDR